MRGAGQTGQVEGGAPGPRSRVPIRAAGAWHAARCGVPFGPPPLLRERGSRDRRVTGDSRTVFSVPVRTEYGNLPAQNTAATSRARHPRSEVRRRAARSRTRPNGQTHSRSSSSDFPFLEPTLETMRSGTRGEAQGGREGSAPRRLRHASRRQHGSRRRPPGPKGPRHARPRGARSPASALAGRGREEATSWSVGRGFHPTGQAPCWPPRPCAGRRAGGPTEAPHCPGKLGEAAFPPNKPTCRPPDLSSHAKAQEYSRRSKHKTVKLFQRKQKRLLCA